MLVRLLAAAAVSGALIAACAQPSAQSGAITGSSKTRAVHGQYARVALDSVDRVSLEKGRLVLHGGAATVAVDLPQGVDTGKPTRHWALTTDSAAGRVTAYTFTHAETIEDFTIELPAVDAELRYGVFQNGGGGEVMALAWGAGGTSYFGWLSIGVGP